MLKRASSLDSTAARERHLRVISSLPPAITSRSARAPDPHMPPRPTPAMRRVMFGEFASLLLLVPEAGASKASELDGDLLDCCAEVEALDRDADRIMDEVEAMNDDDPGLMAALVAAHPLFVAYGNAVGRATQLPARTPEGLRAKAELLLLHIRVETDHTALAKSLARDVVGRA